MISLKDKSQQGDLMIDLLFEILCEVNSLKNVMAAAITREDEAAGEKLHEIDTRDSSSFRDAMRDILSHKFDLETRR